MELSALQNKRNTTKKARKSLVEILMKTRFLSFGKLLEFYPPFLFFGVKIKISEDFKQIRMRIPLRFYIKNNTGVMFGGVMCLTSDPFPALLLQKIVPNTIAYTLSHQLEYLRPAKSSVEMLINISDEVLLKIHQDVLEKGRAEAVFEYYFTNSKGKRVAKVTSKAFLKKKTS